MSNIHNDESLDALLESPSSWFKYLVEEMRHAAIQESSDAQESIEAALQSNMPLT
jgi:hypothetical protein